MHTTNRKTQKKKKTIKNTKNENKTSENENVTDKLNKHETKYIQNKKKSNKSSGEVKGTDNSLLSIWYTNADVLTKDKINELKLEIANNPPDVIAVCEFKPKNYTRILQETEYQLENYELELKGLNDRGPTRGVAVYVHKSIVYRKINLLRVFEKNEVPDEALSLEIVLGGGEKMMFTNIYRSPNSSQQANESINAYLRKIGNMTQYRHKVVVGDFNRKDVNWENLTSPSEANSEFIEAVRDSFMTQHILTPTRGRGTNDPSLLDLVFTSGEDDVEEIELCSPLGKSDHDLIKITYRCSPEIQKDRKVLDFRKADFAEMKKELTLDWREIFKSCNGDIDLMWKKFEERFKKAEEKHIPVRVLKPGKTQFRYTLDKKTLRVRKKKYRLWKRYLQTKDGKHYKEFCRCRNQLRRLTRRDAKLHEKRIAKNVKTNVKSFWSYVRTKTKLRPAIPNLYDEEKDDETSNDTEKATVLGKFFSSVFVREPPLNRSATRKQFEIHEALSIEVDEDKVRKKLLSLNVSKSSGPDKMHPRIFKELADCLTKPLFIIFDHSLKIGRLPHRWKEATITAVYKNKGNKQHADNYRPISLTSIACKMMETIIREPLLQYLNANALLSNKQFGFRNGRSTILQLLHVVDRWTKVLDNGGMTDVVYFDFQKAFDTVPHERLIEKLREYQLNDTVLNWIKDFLSNRTQRVCVNGSESETFPVLSGVPQGSVLGPVLFIMYINSLIEEAGDVDLWLYADDTKLFKEVGTEDDKIQLEIQIDRLRRWTDTSLLKFHPDKCKVLRLKSKKKETNVSTSYEMNGLPMKNVTKIDDLGIWFSDDLSFEEHITRKVNKASSLCGMIRRTFSYLDREIFTKIFKSIVRPHLEYGASVWNPHHQRLITLLENVQRRATRCVPGLENLTYKQRLERLNLPTLQYRRYRGDMIEVYKIAHNIYDVDATHGLIDFTSKEAKEHDLRQHTFNIQKESCKKDVRRYAFRSRVTDQWNHLPTEIAEAPSLNTFKNRLDHLWKCVVPIMFDPECDLHQITSSRRNRYLTCEEE